ncbi:DUF1289 domain-containing protein [Pacificimonas flava]|uniref:DUF1289 domain-containing protein n=1 Tax=Pacificimonas flava TaxID=1234595 RepID=UPI00098FD60B|nr:DUF1289 domain-containing protein [Pacificimonas flava]
MPATTIDDPQSPCQKICRLSANGNVCTGCGRTLVEIAEWSEMSPDQRRAVIQAAERRRVEGFTL